MNTYRLILGYIIGFCIFIVLIPLLLVTGSYHPPFFHGMNFIPDIYVRLIIALPLFCTGLLFAIWSNVFLYIRGKGGPVDAFNISISPRSEKLVTTGPYRYTRNPMVFGALCLYTSIAVFVNSPDDLIIILLCIPLFIVFLKYSEEKRLLKDFGAEFIKYKSEVPMIIPFTKIKKKKRNQSGQNVKQNN